MTDSDDDMRRILSNMPDKFDILEDGIDFQTQQEYMELSHSYGHGKLTEQETLKLSYILFSKNTPIEGKKKALSLLAHLGTVVAFRQIEKYSKSPDKELTQWTMLALRECRMFLESSMDDENTGFIISGLGGSGDRLRYYFLVLPLLEKSFTNTQKDIIRTFEYYYVTNQDIPRESEIRDIIKIIIEGEPL